MKSLLQLPPLLEMEAQAVGITLYRQIILQMHVSSLDSVMEIAQQIATRVPVILKKEQLPAKIAKSFAANNQPRPRIRKIAQN